MDIISRAAWGARAFTCSEPLPTIDTLVVHYSAADADEQADHANCAARVRGIQNFHMSSTPSDPSKPWCDIAYNFLFCKHGFVFEGRGWTRKSGATGADNSHTIAICFLGDDTANRDDVTFAGREALGAWLRLASSKLDGPQGVKGHRDFMQTSCPGDQLETWIRSGKWRTIGLPRFRAELWALQKKDGKLRPALLDKSRTVSEDEAERRLKLFTARVAARYVSLALRRRRPQIRGASV